MIVFLFYIFAITAIFTLCAAIADLWLWWEERQAEAERLEDA